MYKSVILSFIVLLFGGQACFAAVSLSVNPVDGSNSVRFRPSLDSVLERKEVRVRINSNDGNKYQVFQRLMEPLINEKGETLDWQFLQTATVPSSNSSGTLYIQNIDRLSMGDQLIYSSGQNGESDSFVVVYAVDPEVASSGGVFGGRMVFSVREIGEPSQAQASMNIVVESQSSLKVKVSGGHSKDVVRVKDTDLEEQNADFVKVSFSGAGGQEVRVYQQVDSLPLSVAGSYLNAEVLSFSVDAVSNQGSRVAGTAPITVSNVLVYSGKADANDVLVRLFFDKSKVSSQDAGLYIGRIRYVVETDKVREEFLIDLECEVKPIFTVDVVLPPEGVSFDNVLPNAPAREQEIQVEVRSNLHRPYQVLQDLQSPMTNEKGQVLKKDYFTVQVELPTGVRGKTRFGDFMPMEVGEFPVFSSDSQGTPARFKVMYRLQGYPQMSGGSFAAQIKYSLNQN